MADLGIFIVFSFLFFIEKFQVLLDRNILAFIPFVIFNGTRVYKYNLFFLFQFQSSPLNGQYNNESAFEWAILTAHLPFDFRKYLSALNISLVTGMRRTLYVVPCLAWKAANQLNRIRLQLY
jgi:hypothetical protein